MCMGVKEQRVDGYTKCTILYSKFTYYYNKLVIFGRCTPIAHESGRCAIGYISSLAKKYLLSPCDSYYRQPSVPTSFGLYYNTNDPIPLLFRKPPKRGGYF